MFGLRFGGRARWAGVLRGRRGAGLFFREYPHMSQNPVDIDLSADDLTVSSFTPQL